MLLFWLTHHLTGSWISFASRNGSELSAKPFSRGLSLAEALILETDWLVGRLS